MVNRGVSKLSPCLGGCEAAGVVVPAATSTLSPFYPPQRCALGVAYRLWGPRTAAVGPTPPTAAAVPDCPCSAGQHLRAREASGAPAPVGEGGPPPAGMSPALPRHLQPVAPHARSVEWCVLSCPAWSPLRAMPPLPPHIRPHCLPRRRRGRGVAGRRRLASPAAFRCPRSPRASPNPADGCAPLADVRLPPPSPPSPTPRALGTATGAVQRCNIFVILALAMHEPCCWLAVHVTPSPLHERVRGKKKYRAAEARNM